MLFNSPEFLFAFLPLTLLAFFFCARRWGNEAAIGVLVVCSLFFYSWWNPVYLLLLLFSMVFNFKLGQRLGNSGSKTLLTVGVAVNLALIAYYKYAGFIVFNINATFDTSWDLGQILLPLAISFFTFQQIAYLVDSYKGITREYSFIHYALFVCFFPQLIAGPIVHHKEMLPQFMRNERYRFEVNHFVVGISIFAIGLFKKTVLADGVAVYANPVFAQVDAGQTVDFFTAWGGALAYTFQLYFDFSGYSDMAIGLARMFGIILPLNFYSPYKSASISEFWRRWHITLSRFLRDYIYIPLGGNRKGETKRYTNLFITMLLGGLWHGAGWNFVIWGALHGFYLAINHGWQRVTANFSEGVRKAGFYVFVSWMLTMLCVVIGWVFFRAVTLDGATGMLQSMAGMNGVAIPNGIAVRLGLTDLLYSLGISTPNGGGEIFMKTWLWNVVLLFAVVLLPNVQDLFARYQGSLSSLCYARSATFWPLMSVMQGNGFRVTWYWAAATGAMAALAVLTLSQVSEFLYFQF
ncbi:MBOAT family O-acyltransferase [Lacimicrobium alkaliphilum]|uniref:Probable alginate O-acetylase n=1 Tax=Lacimicrobium alkaliphilum TaxID=1526571 RepID=A0A0U2RK91_9ALTE|nr:MBOAT family protein [Lacimicrobium alkaliphilum]ALS97674.1 alginate O-acetyltransferase [Lacimicrobium alkaliphilum]